MISKEEAIKELEFRRQITGGRFGEALDMAITALKLNPQAAREAIDELIKAAQSQPPADGWIPCSERLPEKEGVYVVTERTEDGRRRKTIDMFNGEEWLVEKHHSDVKVIAWMPAEPYKGVE